MQKYFDSSKAYSLFRSLIDSAPEKIKVGFIRIVSDAYAAKQASDDDTLKTFRLTNDEVKSLWQNYENSGYASAL